MTPNAGPYGTELLIEGEGFGDVALLLDLTATDGTVHQFEASEWADNLIRARVRFPAETGEVSFCKFTNAVSRAPGCSEGQSRTAVGTFSVVSEWQAGHAQEFWGGVLTASILDDGSVAAVSAGRSENDQPPHLVHFGESDFTPQAVEGLPSKPHRLVLLESADGRPEIVTTSSGDQVAHHRWQGDVFETVEVGMPGRVLAGGRDDSGRFAWVAHEGSVSRLRIDDDWTVDRSVAGNVRTAALTADGTLVAVRVLEVGDILDYRYRVDVVSLAPNADSFEDLGEASVGSHDDISWVDIGVSQGGEVVLVAFCAEDEGSTENCDHRRVRSAAGTWSDAPALPPGGLLTVGERSLAIAFADDRGIVVQPDVDQGDEIVVPAWPASPVALLAGSADFRVLVRSFFDVYAPRQTR
jgi:hypothetical protein